MFFEGAGKITGGSKVRMAERDREGGCRRRGVAFSIPLERGEAASEAAEGIAQQIEISAAHQCSPALHEPDRSIAEVMGFPGACGDALGPKERFGNGAMRYTVLASIKRAQGKDQAIAALRWQLSKGWARRVIREGPPQTPRGMRAQLEELIEGNLRGVARANTGLSFEPRAVVDGFAPQKHVPAIGCLANYNIGEIAQSDKGRRIGMLSRGRNKGDNRRRNRGRPEHCLLAG